MDKIQCCNRCFHLCPASSFCFFLLGLGTETGLCASGYFCSNSSVAKTPSQLSNGGGMCQKGTYCPEGSPVPRTCPAGQHCDSDALGAPSGNCSAGYFCLGGAQLSKPTDGTTGNVCPAGSYCPEGSKNFNRCPPGTFSSNTENKELANCGNCTRGFFCNGWGNTGTTDECDAGFYCPPGQSERNPNGLECIKGHYCPKGSPEPVRCDSGSYQDETGQWSCKVSL